MARMTTHELLVTARNRIDLGWCRRLLRDRDGNVCALGGVNVSYHGSFAFPLACFSSAVVRVITPDPVYVGAIAALFDAQDVKIEMEGSPAGWERSDSVADYNNTRNDKQEVLDWFDRAIAATAPAPEDLDISITEERELVPA